MSIGCGKLIKTDGGYYENVKQLHKWVKYLDDHEMYKASDIEIQSMVEWANGMMNMPVNNKQLARWVNDTART